MMEISLMEKTKLSALAGILQQQEQGVEFKRWEGGRQEILGEEAFLPSGDPSDKGKCARMAETREPRGSQRKTQDEGEGSRWSSDEDSR
jgi:hypothetical protein